MYVSIYVQLTKSTENVFAYLYETVDNIGKADCKKGVGCFYEFSNNIFLPRKLIVSLLVCVTSEWN